MNNKQYYIKYIWGPRGQSYPDNNIVHFAEGSEKQCERFKNCAGFLLYETCGHERLKGAMAIYAWGIVNPNQGNLNVSPRYVNGKRFTSGVRVILKKRLNPKDGIPLTKIRELTGVGNMQRRGGLLQITENQFKRLRGTLKTL